MFPARRRVSEATPSGLLRFRNQAGLSDISEDGAVSQAFDKQEESISKERTKKPVGILKKSLETNFENNENPKKSLETNIDHNKLEIVESIMNEKSVVYKLAGIKERMQMLSFMITDCQASFEAKHNYHLRRAERAFFLKTVIYIVFIIINVGLLYLFIINSIYSIFED